MGNDIAQYNKGKIMPKSFNCVALNGRLKEKTMIQALIGPVTWGLLDKFIEDKDQKNKLAHEIATMAEKQMHEQVMGQT